MNTKSAFTLSEIMVVIAVIGVLSVVLLPIANQVAPDSYTMQSKKTISVVTRAIQELVNSPKYFNYGDLGIKPDDTLTINSGYLCNSIADIVATKENNCYQDTIIIQAGPAFITSLTLQDRSQIDILCNSLQNGSAFTPHAQSKSNTGSVCNGTPGGSGFISGQKTPNNAINNQTGANIGGDGSQPTKDTISHLKLGNNAEIYFDINFGSTNSGKRLFGDVTGTNPPLHRDVNGFDGAYGIICIDTDGKGQGEVPFGLAVRSDGKIIQSLRAELLMSKSIQKRE